MSTRPVDFDDGSKLIFSVIKKVRDRRRDQLQQGGAVQRYEYGSLAATSALKTAGSASFGPAPDYQAANSDNDTNLQVTNLPAGTDRCRRHALRHGDLHPASAAHSPRRFGITVPRPCIRLRISRAERGMMNEQTHDSLDRTVSSSSNGGGDSPALLLFTGLAVDSGRGVPGEGPADKAVDGAALAAARKLNSGNPEGEAARIFRANFPPATSARVGRPIRRPMPISSVSTVDRAERRQHRHRHGHGDAADDLHEARQTSTTVTVSSTGEATRRMVDLSLVLDVSSSIGSAVGRGEGCRADVHRRVRREQRSPRAAHLRQRRQRARPDAVQPRVRQGRS